MSTSDSEEDVQIQPSSSSSEEYNSDRESESDKSLDLSESESKTNKSETSKTRPSSTRKEERDNSKDKSTDKSEKDSKDHSTAKSEVDSGENTKSISKSISRSKSRNYSSENSQDRSRSKTSKHSKEDSRENSRKKSKIHSRAISGVNSGRNSRENLEEEQTVELSELSEHLSENELGTEKTEGKPPKYTSIQIFHHRIIAASIIRGINLFRETNKKEVLQENDHLNRLAFKYSESIAEDDINTRTHEIEKLISRQPFVFYEIHSCKHPSSDNAFTTVINNWTTDPAISKSLLFNFNCAGVGVSINEYDEAYFSLILGLRSFIGCDRYKKMSLYSIMMAEKCLKVVNDIRTNQFHLRPFFLNQNLCNSAYKFAQVEKEQITSEIVEKTVGYASKHIIAFGKIRSKNITPEAIVQEWMNQLGKTESVLGDYNRVGFGFFKNKDTVYSCRILARYLESSIVDGTETMLGNNILADQFGEILNHFREQHGLSPLTIEDDLTQIAQLHSEYIANKEIGENPIEADYFQLEVKPQFIAVDITHLTCLEIGKAPKALMTKWRNDQKCVSVLLNQIDSMGIGLCFDENYVCHSTVIVGSRGIESGIVNKIVLL